MTPAARIAAAAELLDEILEGAPAEKVLTGWARRSRFAGSKDRAAVRDHVFDSLRNLRSFAVLGGSMSGRGLMIGMLRAQDADLAAFFSGEGHAPAPLSDAESAAGHAAADLPESIDLPDWIWPRFEASLGADAIPVADILRYRAPAQVRVNMARIGREALQARLAEEGIQAEPVPLADTALEVIEGARKLSGTRAFAEGLFEMQDAASQAVCAALPVRDGQRVLDYCAGGGGKTLALGARAKLQLFAHDASTARMKDLPDRAARAGVGVGVLADTQQMEREAPFDLVLCDVPCSGSGAWRRAPEGKWRLTEQALDELLEVQASILDSAAPLVAPGGHLAYATCSLLDDENFRQVDAFLARTGDVWRQISARRFTPLEGGDGFFCAVLERR